MGDDPEYALGWTEHVACRHSAGHMYLLDGELSMIPARVAQRASRIGYRVKSYITWNKDTTPEPVKSRVTRQAEVILHLSRGTTPYFDKSAWSTETKRLGGPNEPVESAEKITDVWHLPTGSGKNGHGAEFGLSLPGRCITLTSRPGDLVLDPFVGSGTTALAAMELKRRCIGLDTSQSYIATAKRRVKALASRLSTQMELMELPADTGDPVPTNGHTSRHGKTGKTGKDGILPMDVAGSKPRSRAQARR
jgi:DNA modification methylase